MDFVRGARDAISKKLGAGNSDGAAISVISGPIMPGDPSWAELSGADNVNVNVNNVNVNGTNSTGVGGVQTHGVDELQQDQSNLAPAPAPAPGSGSGSGSGTLGRMRGAISGVKHGLSGAISKFTSDGQMGGDAATGQPLPMKMASRPSLRAEHGYALLSEQELEHFSAGPRALAWTDFASAGPEELSLVKGQCVALRKAINADWVVCTTVGGVSGIVPLQFLSVIVPLPGHEVGSGIPASEHEPYPTLERAEAAASTNTAAANDDGSTSAASNGGSSSVAGGAAMPASSRLDATMNSEQIDCFTTGPRATAISDFNPNMLNGLQLTKGQSVALRKVVNENWFVATATSGESGLVPKSYLLLLQDVA